MLRHGDHGIVGLDRFVLSGCAQADRGTVHTPLRGLVESGWVEASRSNVPNTSVPAPTFGVQIYYDPPPRPLTCGEMACTFCGLTSRIVGRYGRRSRRAVTRPVPPLQWSRGSAAAL